MSESLESRARQLADAIERLEAMTTDHGEHWDLSENDESAIALVLDELKSRAAFASEVAEQIRDLMCPLCARGVEYIDGFHRLKDGMVPKNEPYRKVRCASVRIRAQFAATKQEPSK